MSSSSGVANGVTYCDTMYDFSASVVIHRKIYTYSDVELLQI